jgi:hypothetical protein
VLLLGAWEFEVCWGRGVVLFRFIFLGALPILAETFFVFLTNEIAMERTKSRQGSMTGMVFFRKFCFHS